MSALGSLVMQACIVSTSLSDPCANPANSRRPAVVAHAVDLSINAGLGALTAALRAKLGGRRVWPAVKNGAMGGVINYGGKRIIGTREAAFRLLGREVAGVGASVIRNAGDGRAPFAAAILPFGPARFYVEPTGVHVKVDLVGSLFLFYTAVQPHARLDWGRSLVAGTPIFTDVAWLRGHHQGSHFAGVVSLAGGAASREYIAHELVHVAQYDFTFIAWGEPLERALVPSLPGGRLVHRYFDVGANIVPWELGNRLVPYRQRPWEQEAALMTKP